VQTLSIPMKNLVVAPTNVRLNDIQNIDELAASIKALTPSLPDTEGLISPLLVVDEGGTFNVIAGQRRLAALKALKRHNATCIVVDAEKAAQIEISLFENESRQALHPFDMCAAFLALIEDGYSTPDLATHFNITERVVKQRARLALIDPEVKSFMRANAIREGIAQALTLCDTERQKEWQAAYEANAYWAREAYSVQSWARNLRIPVENALFDVEKEDCGGVVRDLFDETDRSYFIDTAAFWDAQNIEIEKLRAELILDWREVTVLPIGDRWDYSKYEALALESGIWCPEWLASLEAAQSAFDTYRDELAAKYDDESAVPKQCEDKLDRLATVIDDLNENSVRRDFTGDEKAISDVFVEVYENGRVNIIKGVVPRGANHNASIGAVRSERAEEAKEVSSRTVTKAGASILNYALYSATASVIATDVIVSIRVLLANLVCSHVGWVRASSEWVDDSLLNPQVVDAMKKSPFARLSKNKAIFERAFALPDDEVAEWLAVYVAHSVRQHSQSLEYWPASSDSMDLARTILSVSQTSLRDVWQPDGEFFSKMTKTGLASVCRFIGLKREADELDGGKMKARDAVTMLTQAFKQVAEGNDFPSADTAKIKAWNPVTDLPGSV
jgi:ParB family transcriptional regulator, chromosome partitioning protein